MKHCKKKNDVSCQYCIHCSFSSAFHKASTPNCNQCSEMLLTTITIVFELIISILESLSLKPAFSIWYNIWITSQILDILTRHMFYHTWFFFQRSTSKSFFFIMIGFYLFCLALLVFLCVLLIWYWFFICRFSFPLLSIKWRFYKNKIWNFSETYWNFSYLRRCSVETSACVHPILETCITCSTYSAIW